MVDTLLDGTTPPARGDVIAAATVVDGLPSDTEERARLGAQLFEAALDVVCREGDDPSAPRVLGRAYAETDIRFGLEESYRTLARFAPTKKQRVAWVDRANAARPRTLL
jgi:serine/threonine-protein kinase PknG